MQTTSLAKTNPDADYVVRFDLHQRIQHVLMFTTFIILAFTGLPQKFWWLGISQWIIGALGGLESTQTIHHIAAWTMILDCAYHGAYLVYSIAVRRRIRMFDMLPSLKDFRDLVQNVLFFVGFSKKRPQFGRYQYLEKFDYWAVFWGIAIIGGSGLVLLFPVAVSKLLPGPIIPVAHAAHSDEAVLAVAWIFVVHFFYAHLAPAVFPLNTAMFTGKMSRARYLSEHPLAPEVSPRPGAAKEEPGTAPRQPREERRAADGMPTS